MVQARINLLKNRRVLSEKDYQRENKIWKSSILVFVIVIVLTVTSAIWNIIVSTQLTKIEKSISNSAAQLQGLTEANAQQVYLKSRLGLISEFLTSRGVAREAIQRLFSLQIEGATIVSMNFAESNVIATSVTANDISTLNQVIKYYESDGQFFLQVVSGGITRSKNGQYEVDLRLTLPKEVT